MLDELKKCTKEQLLLYVEDDKKIRDKFTELFRRLFKEVYPCENGKEGLELYDSKRVDITITDISMPVMDGLQMSREIKKREQDAVIVVTTAYSDTEYLLEAIEIGVQNYLIKPIDTQKLVKTLLAATSLAKVKQCMIENVNLAQELKEKNAILDSINKNLEERVAHEIEKRIENEKMLIRQSKMATMGEMLNAIAHQWRQPIQIVYSAIGHYELAQESGGHIEHIDTQELFLMIKKQIDYMNQTIDDFKGFLKPTRFKKRFLLNECIKDTISIFTPQANRYNIAIECEMQDKIELFGFPNELKQVLLNLLGNAKDAILERRKSIAWQKMQGTITLKTYKIENECRVVVCDNGGGVPDEIIEKIFEPYFSTKGEDGTGIGLAMVKNIIEEHFDGRVSVYNHAEGACFEMACAME